MGKIIDEALNFYVFIIDLHILSTKFNIKQENIMNYILMSYPALLLLLTHF